MIVLRWVVVFGTALLLWVGYACWQPLQLSVSTHLDVPQGLTLYQLTSRMGRQGLLRHPLPVLLYEHIFARHVRIYAGMYPLEPGMRGLDVLAMLTDSPGRYVQRLTVIEGSTLKILANQLHDLQAQGLLKNDLPADPTQWPSPMQEHASSLEGWLAPDTYGFVPGMSTTALLELMRTQQRHILRLAWASRDPGLPYRSPYEALIMASIIEKETGRADERAHIAGVFVNRLQQKMRLQTDPTVIYGLGDRYTGTIHRQDLRSFSPYNTYQINGLPPTPIAMPGAAAIWAALHPVPTSDLYFVAKGDGSHQFSATLAAQNAAVERYQRHRREDYHAHP